MDKQEGENIHWHRGIKDDTIFNNRGYAPIAHKPFDCMTFVTIVHSNMQCYRGI